MSQQLPPLNALRAFEAVGRLRSFSKAAEELNVTKAAISHQIKGLETFLGFTLFERRNRTVALTSVAELALPQLQLGFDHLAEAVLQMRGHSRTESINVWVAPSFASKWLVPRLHTFANAFPGIDMSIMSDTNLIDVSKGTEVIDQLCRRDNVDVAIMFGSGKYPNYLVDKLFSVDAVPLCNPKLLEHDLYPLQTVDNLKHHTLLHDDTNYAGRPNWPNWLELAGVKGVDASRGMHFNHVSLALEAACDAQGVLLSMEPLAQFDIAAGRLCVPFDLRLPLEHAFYVLRPRSKAKNRPALNNFVGWLLEAASQVK